MCHIFCFISFMRSYLFPVRDLPLFLHPPPENHFPVEEEDDDDDLYSHSSNTDDPLVYRSKRPFRVIFNPESLESSCCICTERVNCVFIPCMHGVVCSDCYAKGIGSRLSYADDPPEWQSDTCPLCSIPIYKALLDCE